MTVAIPELSRPAGIEPPADLLLPAEASAATLVSGPWSLSLRGADIDDIRYDDVLVLRSIRLVARDEDWRTLPIQVDRTDQAVLQPTATGSELTLTGRAGSSGGAFTWVVTLRLDGAALAVHARVETTATFRRNRLGLIVLHPPSLAGHAVTVGHPNGTETPTVFPERISPHQPARDIRSLSWRSESDAVDSVLRFWGDVFEMEDQRNWTDASFKTYSTPLSEPFPVDLSPGTVIEQSVELRCETTESRPADRAGTAIAGSAPVHVAVATAESAARMPVITTSVSSGPTPGGPLAGAFGAVLCELDPATANWRSVLDRAVAEAGSRPLDLRLIVEHDEEAVPVFDRLREARVEPARIGVFHRQTHLSEPDLLTKLQSRLDDRGLTADLVGGTRAHFTELNRNAAVLADWHGPLAFSVTPFMHDRAGHQLVESVGMQRLVAREALDIAHGRPLHIGPITLGARFNAVATTTPPSPGSGDQAFGADLVDGATDERQGSPSLAAWVLASVSALALPGVASLSYFEASGARGLIDADGRVAAAAQVLDWVAGLAGGAVSPLVAEHPAIVGLAVTGETDATAATTVILVGNLGDAPVSVLVESEDTFVLPPGAVRRVVTQAR